MQPQPYYDNRVQPNYDRNVRPVRHDQEPEIGPRVYDKAKYEKTVEQTFGKEKCITNKDNYRDNLFSAAENKKPVVMTFGRGSDPECQKHLEALERAKKASGGKADFCFVDLDKVDPNSAVGKYAIQHIGKDFGTPLTMVFNQHQGEGKTPVIPQRPSWWQKGGLNEQSLLQGIDQAAQIQQGIEIKTGREGSDRTTPVQPDQATITAQKLVEESLKPWKDQKPDELLKGVDDAQRLKLCSDAIALADKSNNPKLKAQVRAMVGFASIGWGGEAEKAGNKELADKHYMRGAEYMMSAGVYNPDIYRYPSFASALRESALPGTTADYLLEQGINNPKWYFPTADQIRDDKNAYQNARDSYNKALQEQMKKPKVLRRPAA